MSRKKAENRLDPPERVTVQLDDIAFEGGALAHDGPRIVFAEYGIPGETVSVQLLRSRAGVAMGRVVEVLKSSPDRVDAPCPYFGACGGCQWQHITYPRQLTFKEHIVREQLRRIGRFINPPVSPAVAAENPWGYRNHLRFTAKRRGEVGFVQRGSHRFLRVDHCLIADDHVNDALPGLQGKCGGMHQLTFRVGVNTDEMLVHPDLKAIEPSIESGQRFYHEEILGRRFRISGASFFQTNTAQTERLVGLVRDCLDLGENETLVDAYAGVGTFAVILAPHDVLQRAALHELHRRRGQLQSVAGAEFDDIAQQCADDAMVNIAGMPNIQYHKGKVEELLPQISEPADVLILDPPRQGCDAKALEAVIQMAPNRIAYVSCDPSTLARDLRILVDGGFELREVTPVDMFPQTHHIECVATLRRSS